MSLDRLKDSLEKSQIIQKKKYSYFINPITDGIPQVDPELLNEVANELVKRIKKIGDFDKIVAIEAMGVHLATALSLKLNKPFVIIRKRAYHLPDEKIVEQKTAYSRTKLHINGIKKGERLVVVDDVLSTGGTISAVISGLDDLGAEILKIFMIIEKGNISEKINHKYGVYIESLVKIDIVDEKVIIEN